MSDFCPGNLQHFDILKFCVDGSFNYLLIKSILYPLLANVHY